MSEGVGEARLEAEGELALARLALDDGDASHAARHLGNAIADDPSLPAVYEALRELDAASGGALALFPVAEGSYIGVIAARSYLLACTGVLDDALAFLCAVAAEQPGKPWAAAGWLQAPGLADRLDPRRAASVLTRLAMRVPDPADADVATQLMPFLEVARGIAARLRHAELLAPLSALPRRLGATDEAVSWCQRAEAEQTVPSASAAIMLGYALRNAGRFDEMHQAWLRALSRDPGNVPLHVDIAEHLAARGRRSEGIAWLDKALALAPEHGKAFPSSCEMRYAEDRDIGHLVRLADWWRAHPEHDYADQMLAKACRDRTWLNAVPHPTEAICNVLAQLAEKQPDPGALHKVDAKLALSALEVPSAMAAVRTAMPRIVVEVQGVPKPDIRIPVAAGRYRVWAYEGNQAVAAVPQPSQAAAAALRAVAEDGFWRHPLAAYDRAVSLSGLSLGDLLGLLAHIPSVPDRQRWQQLHRSRPAYWPRFAQVWACLGLLHHRADELWPTSTRRAVLIDLVRSVEDWVTDAAMFALVAAAWADSGIRGEVAEVVGLRFLDAARAYQQREVTIVPSTAHLVLATPGMEPEVAALARDLLRRIDGESKQRRA
jgi:tetratricopeptide (TPR) repeat protein